MPAWVEKLNQYGYERQPVLFVISYDKSEALLFSPEEAEKSGVQYSLPLFPRHMARVYDKEIRFEKRPVSYKHYSKAFEEVRREFERGNTFLLNLTFPSQISTNMSLNDIFNHSDAPYRLLIPGRFTLFSPESFVRIENNEIASFPMKGTAKAGEKDAKKHLIEDSKELAEHTAVVDLIRNDLSMVAKNVTVPRFRYLESFQELLQVSSEIRGTLAANWRCRLGEIFECILPAGSISGAPKKKTMDIIRTVEGYDRGFFSGVFGYFDGDRVDSGVMIRFTEQTPDGLVFKSGGGLMVYSDPQKEYNELVQKVYLPMKQLRHSIDPIKTGAAKNVRIMEN